MTILVTGAAGYLGNQTVKKLVESGRSVRALVRHRAKAVIRLGGVADHIEIVEGDVTRPESLASVHAGRHCRDSLCRHRHGEGRTNLRSRQLSRHGKCAASGRISRRQALYQYEPKWRPQ